MENTADVAAKDGAQETLVNINALLCSLVLLPMVSGHQLVIWMLYFLFTYIHLYANYRAVTSLKFRTFNCSLLHIVVEFVLLFHFVFQASFSSFKTSLISGQGGRGCEIR